MKILVDIGDPPHVHVLKNMILELERRNHKVKIITRDKEITLKLLDACGFKYETRGKGRTGVIGKAVGLLEANYKIYKIARKFKPDILVGVNNPYVAHVGKLIRKPSFVFVDTEHARLQNFLIFPFATKVFTPSCYIGEDKKNQVRYKGYHELAYLHPKYFKPNPEILKEIGLTERDNFVVMRFVAWDASHDIGHEAFNLETKVKLAKELEKHAKVFITSEAKIEKELEKYQLTVSPEKIHDLLYYAALYIGEGATMTSECAVLGTPALFVNPFKFGYTAEEEEKYSLVFNISDSMNDVQKITNKALEIILKPEFKKEWAKKRERLLKDKIDVTKFMVNMVENYKSLT